MARRNATRPRRSGSRGGPGRWLPWLLLVVLLAVGGWWFWHRQPAKVPRRPKKVAAPPVTPPKVPPSVVQPSVPVVTNRPTPAPAPVPTPTPVPKTNNPEPARTNATTLPFHPPPTAPARTNIASTNLLAAQVALTAHGISSGPVDGLGGAQTAAALRAFQMQQGLEQTGWLDRDTLRELHLDHETLTNRVITDADLARLQPVPKTWLAKSELSRLDYETLLELIAEQSQSHPALIRRLNPGVDWTAVKPGTELVIPAAVYPPARRANLVRVSLGQRWIRAFDAQGNLLAHFPCSIGHIAEKRPVGELHVVVAVKDPNYTFDPAVFPESEEARELGRRLIIPPGPNNPVGVAWIGLDRPGYGMHGTPVPEQVGRTESHGCFRLANWNAEYLRQMVVVGTPVWVEP